jgi:hypothetical protein
VSSVEGDSASKEGTVRDPKGGGMMAQAEHGRAVLQRIERLVSDLGLQDVSAVTSTLNAPGGDFDIFLSPRTDGPAPMNLHCQGSEMIFFAVGDFGIIEYFAQSEAEWNRNIADLLSTIESIMVGGLVEEVTIGEWRIRSACFIPTQGQRSRLCWGHSRRRGEERGYFVTHYEPYADPTPPGAR